AWRGAGDPCGAEPAGRLSRARRGTGHRGRDDGAVPERRGARRRDRPGARGAAPRRARHRPAVPDAGDRRDVIQSGAMRAVHITDLTGPDSALRLADVPEPEPSHPLTPGRGVVVEVRAAGVSFPELLQTRGEYQMKPPLPFVPGSEVGGVVRSAPDGAPVKSGDRVAAFCLLGAWAETAVAP